MGSFDQVGWHSGGAYFPKNLPWENGATHIGMFIAWIINNELINPDHLKDSKKGILDVLDRKITGRGFLLHYCDGKFTDIDLNEEGLAFTKVYYDGFGEPYFNDFYKTFKVDMQSMYHVKDNWINFEKISHVIDLKYEIWKSKRDNKK